MLAPPSVSTLSCRLLSPEEPTITFFDVPALVAFAQQASEMPPGVLQGNGDASLIYPFLPVSVAQSESVRLKRGLAVEEQKRGCLPVKTSVRFSPAASSLKSVAAFLAGKPSSPGLPWAWGSHVPDRGLWLVWAAWLVVGLPGEANTKLQSSRAASCLPRRGVVLPDSLAPVPLLVQRIIGFACLLSNPVLNSFSLPAR